MLLIGRRWFLRLSGSFVLAAGLVLAGGLVWRPPVPAPGGLVVLSGQYGHLCPGGTGEAVQGGVVCG